MVMKTTPKALKDLFVALGGNPSTVDGLKTVDVLNAIAEKYEGEGDATKTPDAIDAITAVAGNIGGGGDIPQHMFSTVNVVNNTGMVISISTAKYTAELGVFIVTTSIQNGVQKAINVPHYGMYPKVRTVLDPSISSGEIDCIVASGSTEEGTVVEVVGTKERTAYVYVSNFNNTPTITLTMMTAA